jgi:hypothetical protein
VIAFEDIGIGSVDAVTVTVAAAGDSAWRRAHGGDMRLSIEVARILAGAPKDRSADYLVGAKDHPLLAGFAQEMTSASLTTRLSRIGSRALDLPHRATRRRHPADWLRRAFRRSELIANMWTSVRLAPSSFFSVAKLIRLAVGAQFQFRVCQACSVRSLLWNDGCSFRGSAEACDEVCESTTRQDFL